MFLRIIKSSGIVATIAIGLAGCAGNNGLSNITTASVPPKPTVDPICVQLAGEIDSMRKGGILAKVDTATRRKRRLGRDDVKKVNAYILASEQFQVRCGKVPVMVAKPPMTTIGAVKPATVQKVGTATVKPLVKTTKR
jgi:hypothetical protein